MNKNELNIYMNHKLLKTLLFLYMHCKVCNVCTAETKNRTFLK